MIVGIDLGTTNSAVAYIDEKGNPQVISNGEGDRTTPSVILFEEGSPVIGKVAKDNCVLDPFNVVQFVKRQIGNSHFSFENDNGETFSAEELSALILKKIKMDAEAKLGEKIESAVITVPAYFNDAQRNATQHAGRIAGLNVIGVINEPTAAALAYGIVQKNHSHNIMVYDLGGGTFDVTIMHINDQDIVIKATSGDKNLGGFDFDNAIMNYVINKFEEENDLDLMDDEVAMQELREKAENAKKALTSKNKTLISLRSQGKSIKCEITKENFEEMTKTLLDRTVLIMEMALEDAGMAWQEIDKILLVGGSTKMPIIQNVIYRTTGKKPSNELNPDEVVAIGAAYYANMQEDNPVQSDQPITKIIDVNAHSLGIICNDENGREVNSIIIPRNTSLPAQEYQEFYITTDNQETVRIRVTEGEDEDIDYINIIGVSILKLPKNRVAGDPIRIVMGYDKNGVVHVNVIDGIDNTDLGEMHIERDSNLTEEEVEAKKTRLSKINIE